MSSLDLDDGPLQSLRPLQMERWLDACTAHRQLTILVASCFCIVIGGLDLFLENEVPISGLCLPFVVAVCWVASLQTAMVLSLFCAMAWIIDDTFFLHSASPGITLKEAWLTAVHACFFLAIVSVIWRLRCAYERERAFARIDALTGLLNTAAFNDTAEREAARCRRTSSPLTVAFIDCDNFKQVNDTLGHRTGDRLLKAIARTLCHSVREMDAVARLGGDEFALLLPEASKEKAEIVIERVRTHLNKAMAAENWPVTFSIGVAVYHNPEIDADALLHGADQLMYDVKRNAKDGVAFQVS
ncbi:GGDEF domain-containing protein [Blastopirellula sp. J2-11]|uniref:GGDEF domain-containing protein n=1 Tax=Blastopirellula sp. J2-11 TaxID=2943192 RepID=UPI0021C58C1D|nr:GGDEF domain-containing protein [Blastopirellula sp. J2-11]UUO06855.1 GGDEF domain-containing protein [Blastopirellula sp. J2-11]